MVRGVSCNLNQRDDAFLITTNADKTAKQSEFVKETCIWYKAHEEIHAKRDLRYAWENNWVKRATSDYFGFASV